MEAEQRKHEVKPQNSQNSYMRRYEDIDTNEGMGTCQKQNVSENAARQNQDDPKNLELPNKSEAKLAYTATQ